jgi:hypothetical protein
LTEQPAISALVKRPASGSERTCGVTENFAVSGLFVCRLAQSRHVWFALAEKVGNPADLEDRFRTRTLYKERYVVVFPPDHRLGALNAVRLSDLSGESYVDRLSCEMREMVMKVCQTEAVELCARFRSEREDWVQARGQER